MHSYSHSTSKAHFHTHNYYSILGKIVGKLMGKLKKTPRFFPHIFLKMNTFFSTSANVEKNTHFETIWVKYRFFPEMFPWFSQCISMQVHTQTRGLRATLPDPTQNKVCHVATNDFRPKYASFFLHIGYVLTCFHSQNYCMVHIQVYNLYLYQLMLLAE